MNKRAPRNRTLRCTIEETTALSTHLLQLAQPASIELLRDRVINQDFQSARPFLPDSFVDLLILDPPYNLTKDFNGNVFRAQEAEAYTSWFDELLSLTIPLLRQNSVSLRLQ